MGLNKFPFFSQRHSFGNFINTANAGFRFSQNIFSFLINLLRVLVSIRRTTEIRAAQRQRGHLLRFSPLTLEEFFATEFFGLRCRMRNQFQSSNARGIFCNWFFQCHPPIQQDVSVL